MTIRAGRLSMHAIYAPPEWALFAFRTCCVPHRLQMEVSLVCRQHKLQYDPPLEVLRMQHVAKHLNGFLGLPLRMKGVSSLSERQGFFAAIADADPASIARVSEHSVRRVLLLFWVIAFRRQQPSGLPWYDRCMQYKFEPWLLCAVQQGQNGHASASSVTDHQPLWPAVHS